MGIPSETQNPNENNNQEFTVNTVKNNIVIGELHLREKPSLEENERFNQLLEQNKDSIFVLEADPSKSDVFEDNQSSPTFMSQALKYSKEKNIRAEILDDEKISGNRYEIWKEAGSEFSQEEYDNIIAMYIMRVGIYKNNLSLKDVVSNVNNSEKLDAVRKQTYLNAFSRYMEILQSEKRDEKLKNIEGLILSYIDYDAVCRERNYQKKVGEIKDGNPDKKIFAVFGKSHTEGISKTLEDTNYRTQLLPVAKMKWLISSIF